MWRETVKRIAIYTDFTGFQSAYSLCRVVANQVKMLVAAGYKPLLIGRPGIQKHQKAFRGAAFAVINPGTPSANEVAITNETKGEIESIAKQMMERLSGYDVILTHDLIYQATLWRDHVAARRVAREWPNQHWLHWVHSGGEPRILEGTGQFKWELEGAFPHSRLVVFHQEEQARKAKSLGYNPWDAVIVPNPLDLTAYYHPAAQQLIEENTLWQADAIAVYPCRLDRGKQPEVVIEIMAELRGMGNDARVVIVDFHSTGGDKATYRDELKQLAKAREVPVIFTSDLSYPEANYQIPHRAVMDLFDYGDVLIHPSRSESDSLVLPEAAWKRCGLVLNFDLPLFRQWQGQAVMAKFSSNVDALTGGHGATNTKYGDRRQYMKDVAAELAYLLKGNPTLALHAEIRTTRSLEAVWAKHLWPAIEGF